jgi:hypothetical protein
MSSTPIAHSQNRDFTPPVPARLAALRFVLDSYARKEAAPDNRPDDGPKVMEDSANGHRSI